MPGSQRRPRRTSCPDIPLQRHLARSLLYVAVPVLQDGRTIGIVRIAGTLASIEATFQQLQTVMLWALLLTSLLAVLVGMRLAKQFTGPIEEITAVAREIAGGNWEKRAHITLATR